MRYNSSMTYEQETLWLAGWLEGEGSFMCRPNCNEIRISVGSTDEDVVRRAAAAIGPFVKIYAQAGKQRPELIDPSVKVYKGRPSHYQTLWRFEVLGDKAVELGKRILPFMGQRRKAKIEFLLAKAANRMTRSERGKLAMEKRWGKKEKSSPLPFAVNL